MGSDHSQPARDQEQAPTCPPSHAALDTPPVFNQPPISSEPLVDMESSRIQQHGVQKGSETRALLPGKWLARQPLWVQRRALRQLLRSGTSFATHQTRSAPMWNVQGSSDCECFQIDGKPICSWMRVCKIMTGKRAGVCSFSGCCNKATYGGHVKYLDRKAWYLAPVCSSCNSVNRDAEARMMKPGTTLVKIKCHCSK
jgi:hypothetical protein